MRFLRGFFVAGCALAIFASVALAAEDEPSAGPSTPQVVQSSVEVTPDGTEVTTYSDGTKVVSPASPDSFSECPDGWVCLWENKEYGGRMLEFQDRGYWQNLSVYEFNDKTSSWANRTNDDARLSQNAGGGGNLLCLQPNSSNSQLTGFNDEASAIIIYKTSTVC